MALTREKSRPLVSAPAESVAANAAERKVRRSIWPPDRRHYSTMDRPRDSRGLPCVLHPPTARRAGRVLDLPRPRCASSLTNARIFAIGRVLNGTLVRLLERLCLAALPRRVL